MVINYVWKCKESTVVKAILEKKDKFGGRTPSEFQTYYKSMSELDTGIKK